MSRAVSSSFGRSCVVVLALLSALPASAQEKPAPAPKSAAPPSAPAAPAPTDGKKPGGDAKPSDGKKPAAGGEGAEAASPLPPSLYSTRAGLSVREQTDAERKKLARTGFVVVAVTEDSPAAKAGFAVDDIVTSVDAGSFPSSKELVDKLQGAEEGQLFKIAVVRAGKDLVVDVQMPGETKEEREKREEEEQKKKDEEEARLEEEAEKQKEAAEEEARAVAEEQAKKDEALAEAISDADDKFGWLGCTVCSLLCPPGMPIFAIAAFLVDNRPLPEELPPDAPRTAAHDVRY